MTRSGFIWTTLVWTTVLLQGCSAKDSFDKPYNLRQWEKLRLCAEDAFFSGDYKQSTKLLRQALSYANELGSNNFRLPATVLQLADSLAAEHSWQLSLAEYKRALSLLGATERRAATPLRAEHAYTLVRMGEVFLEIGDIDQAKKCLELAINSPFSSEPKRDNMIWERAGRAVVKLALLEEKQGRSTQLSGLCQQLLANESALSSELMEQIHTIASPTEGASEHKNLAIGDAVSLWQDHMLAGAESAKSKDFSKASLAFQAAVSSAPDDEHKAKSLESLAETCAWLGDTARTLQNYGLALELRKKLCRDGDENTDTDLSKLTEVLHANGRFAPARKHLQEQLSLRERLFGADSFKTGEVLARLAQTEFADGDRSASQKHGQQSWSILQHERSSKGRVLKSLDIVAQVLLLNGLLKNAAAANQMIIDLSASDSDRDRFRRNLSFCRLLAIEAQKNSRASNWEKRIELKTTAEAQTLAMQLLSESKTLKTAGLAKASEELKHCADQATNNAEKR